MATRRSPSEERSELEADVEPEEGESLEPARSEGPSFDGADSGAEGGAFEGADSVLSALSPDRGADSSEEDSEPVDEAVGSSVERSTSDDPSVASLESSSRHPTHPSTHVIATRNATNRRDVSHAGSIAHSPWFDVSSG
jgi:hypothetical protein